MAQNGRFVKTPWTDSLVGGREDSSIGGRVPITTNPSSVVGSPDDACVRATVLKRISAATEVMTVECKVSPVPSRIRHVPCICLPLAGYDKFSMSSRSRSRMRASWPRQHTKLARFNGLDREHTRLWLARQKAQRTPRAFNWFIHLTRASFKTTYALHPDQR